MNNFNFKPWIGNNYQSDGIFGKSILILGESFHFDKQCDENGFSINGEDWSDSATDVVKTYLSGRSSSEKWVNTFKKFERALIGRPTDSSDSHEIWNSVAFTNFLQVAMNSARKGAKRQRYVDSADTLFKTIEDVRPMRIIAWGKRLYTNMPVERFEKGEDIVFDNCVGIKGSYSLCDSSTFPILWINHPSTAFSWDKWHQIISKFLNR